MPFATILGADWSKHAGRRAVYRASVAQRTLGPLAAPVGGWTVEAVIAAAESHAARGPVLVGFDAVLGVPRSYWDAARRACRDWASAHDFVDWLPRAAARPGFLQPVRSLAGCALDRPFYVLPPGKGSRHAWEGALARLGAATLRESDRRARANPPFLVAGLPGAVGAATLDLWAGIARLAGRRRSFAVWPFEAGLRGASSGPAVIVAEAYPRALYAWALGGGRRIAKTRAAARVRALAALVRQPWVRAHEVRITGLAAARAGDDAFDALLSTAGLLRRALDGRPLSHPEGEDPIAEGGILGLEGRPPC